MKEIRTKNSIEKQVIELRPITNQLKDISSVEARLNFLNEIEWVKENESIYTDLRDISHKESTHFELVIKSILAIRQNFILELENLARPAVLDKLDKLYKQLYELEIFFWDQGGIVGYHLLILELLTRQDHPHQGDNANINYLIPSGLDLAQPGDEAKEAIFSGLMNLEQIGEIYPVGGAGDRLGLVDEETGKQLPAACLPFLGRPLLAGLIRDVQAREHLYFRLTGKRVVTPVAMMTSSEKENHQLIYSICEENGWFGRSKEDFFFFMQPLVPVVSEEGQWALIEPLLPLFKPGGHGVIWKLAEEKGVFNWFKGRGCNCALIRQINNPMAGLDDTLIALIGQGVKSEKVFGFVACERFLKSAEGIDVLIEKRERDHFTYHITNIEYTHFNQIGLGDIPLKEGSPYSRYPANTNILFASLPAIREVLPSSPIPGMLINMKSKVSMVNEFGKTVEVPGGRLESTMQNIADVLIDQFPSRLSEKEMASSLRTFVVFNRRVKTISTTKQTYRPDQSENGTPEKAFYDLLTNNLELFSQRCRFVTPQQGTFADHLKNGPSCLIVYDPAVGPFYDLIAQKINGGVLKEGAELQIEIAEIRVVNLQLSGSLIIHSLDPLGIKNQSGRLLFEAMPKCRLENVVVENEGMDRSAHNVYWKNHISRQESVSIHLGVGAEFEAIDVRLQGNKTWVIPDYCSLKVMQDENGQLKEIWSQLKEPSWQWVYRWNSRKQIELSIDFQNSV